MMGPKVVLRVLAWSVGTAWVAGTAPGGPATQATPPTDPSAPSGETRFEVKLQEGRLRVGELLTGLCGAAGVPAPETLRDLDWTIDVGSTVGWLQLQSIRSATRGAVSIRTGPDALVVTIDHERAGQLRQQVEALARRWVSETGAEAMAGRSFGISFVSETGGRVPPDALSTVPRRAVLLIHGMDEPGWRWRDLIPALRAAGHPVARFEYPNDGPVADAADLLAQELSKLRQAGVERVDAVTHSLGGLVARDVLTRRAYYGGDGTGGATFPAMDRLIMIGPANHGTYAAVLHGVAEVAERAYRAWQGEAGWLNLSADGRGEAAVDLLPDSVYLRRLNSRPLPAHTRITIVAGRLSPLDAGEVEELLGQIEAMALREDTPPWVRRLAEPGPEGAASLIQAAVRGLGDGVVTLDSARLEGVDDFAVVEAGHQSMITSLLRSDRTPPAIPIVLDRLGPP